MSNEKLGFKKALFGFNSAQVSAYIDDILAQILELKRSQAAALEEMNQKNEDLASKTGDLEAKVASLSEELSQKEGELSSLRDEKTAQQEKIAAMEQKHERLVESYKELEAQYQSSVENEKSSAENIGQLMVTVHSACEQTVEQTKNGANEVLSEAKSELKGYQDKLTAFGRAFAKVREDITGRLDVFEDNLNEIGALLKNLEQDTAKAEALDQMQQQAEQQAGEVENYITGNVKVIPFMDNKENLM